MSDEIVHMDVIDAGRGKWLNLNSGDKPFWRDRFVCIPHNTISPDL